MLLWLPNVPLSLVQNIPVWENTCLHWKQSIPEYATYRTGSACPLAVPACLGTGTNNLGSQEFFSAFACAPTWWVLALHIKLFPPKSKDQRTVESLSCFPGTLPCITPKSIPIPGPAELTRARNMTLNTSLGFMGRVSVGWLRLWAEVLFSGSQSGDKCCALFLARDCCGLIPASN